VGLDLVIWVHIRRPRSGPHLRVESTCTRCGPTLCCCLNFKIYYIAKIKSYIS